MGASKNNSEESLLEAIKFYQSGLLRYIERNDELKMSHGLNKLSSYPIRMCHLQDTGVGRTVNLLVKMEGKVGEQARSLIEKWKIMVDKEKEQLCPNGDSHNEESPEQHFTDEDEKPDSVSGKSSSETNNSSEDEQNINNSKKQRNSSESDSQDQITHISSKSKRHKSSHHRKDERPNSREHSHKDKEHSRSHDKKHSTKSEKDRSSKSERDYSSSHKKEHSSRHHDKHSSKNEKEKSSRHDEKHSSKSYEKHSSKSENKHSSRHDKEYVSKNEKKHSSRHDKEHSSRHKKEDSSQNEEHSSQHKKEHSSKHEKKDRDGNKTEYRESDSKKDEKRSKESSVNNKEKSKNNNREKEETKTKEREDINSHEKKAKNHEDIIQDRVTKDEDKKNSKKEKVTSSKQYRTEISSGSGTSFEEALGMFEIPVKEKKSYSKENSTSSKHHQKETVPSSSANSKTDKSKRDSKSDKKLSTKDKESAVPSGSRTKFEDSMDVPKKGKKSDKKEQTSSLKQYKGEISSASGTSFEDALGMIGTPKKEKKPVKRKIEESIGYEESEMCSSSGTTFEEALGMVEYPKKKKKLNEQPTRSPSPIDNDPPSVPLPSVPLEKLEVYLPSITPNYRPIRVQDSQHSHNESDFMDTFMKNKHHRTKIYSGNKSTYNKVPSLMDFCINLLQNHIDDMEATGGVPYSILKPVLEKATPTQLLRLEFYNSYLTEDTDELWQLHCQKDFRNKTRQECETWREMYERCTDEREARFLTLTQSIKEAKQKSVPIRQTKIAYIDPPMGGSRRPIKHSAAPMAKAKVEAMVRDSKASSDVVVTHQRKASRSQPAPSVSSQAKVKKMAPLMAKSLSAFKNRRYK